MMPLLQLKSEVKVAKFVFKNLKLMIRISQSFKSSSYFKRKLNSDAYKSKRWMKSLRR